MTSTRLPLMSLATHQAICETAVWHGIIVELSDITRSSEILKGLEKIAGKQRMYRTDSSLVAVAGDFSRPERDAIINYLNDQNGVKKYHVVKGTYYDFLGGLWQYELIGRNGEQKPDIASSVRDQV